MNSTKQLCRLCLEMSDDVVNVFQNFQSATIASILSKHFWFQVFENDGLSEWLCQICWIQTKTFHNFYKRLEFRHKNYCKSIKLIDTTLIKQERCDGPVEEAIEAGLNVIKFEVTEFETTEEAVYDVQVTKEDLSDCNDDKSWAKSDDDQTSDDDEGQPRNKRPKIGESETNKTLPKSSNIGMLSKSDLEEQDTKIREFFDMKCEICSDVDFENLQAAKKHYRKIHKIRGYLTCCGKKFQFRYRIMDHIQQHVNPNAHPCDQCGKHFPNRSALKVHIKNHISLNLGMNRCVECSKNYGSAAALRQHVEYKHTPGVDRKLPCDKCDKTFRSNLLLASHIRQVHEFSLEHVCEICARQFKTKNMLLNHSISEHATSPPPKAQCNICGAWLKHAKGLRMHLKRHEEEDSKAEAVKCTICQKEVKHKRSLDNHIRYVHGERHHHCTMCNKSFKTAIILKEHIAIHTGEDLYDCRYCDKKFKSSANMYAHVKKMHFAEWARDFPERVTKNVKTEPAV